MTSKALALLIAAITFVVAGTAAAQQYTPLVALNADDADASIVNFKHRAQIIMAPHWIPPEDWADEPNEAWGEWHLAKLLSPLGPQERIHLEGNIINSDPGDVGTSGFCGGTDYDMALVSLVPMAYLMNPHAPSGHPTLTLQIWEHLVFELLNERGGVENASMDAPGIQCPGWAAPETENHILMTESARYLTNQLLLDRGWDPEDYDNQQNGMANFLRLELTKLLRRDFEEYNGRPYMLHSLRALTNLTTFARDESVRTLAAMVLDYLAAKVAVSSNGLRRRVPFRRLGENRFGDYFDNGPGDPGRMWLAAIAGYPTVGHGKPENHHPPYGALQTFVLPGAYRAPGMILDLAVDKRHHTYYQRFQHRTREIYYAEPEFLISAGGTFVDSDTLSDNDGAGWALETALVPTSAPSFSYTQMLRFEGHREEDEIHNACVAPNFACGLDVTIPPHYLSQACTQVHGEWLFINADGCQMAQDMYIALHTAPCNTSVCSDSASNYGFFEVQAARKMSFDAFVATVLANNAWRQFHPEQPNDYVTVDGRLIQFRTNPSLIISAGDARFDGPPSGRWVGDVVNQIGNTRTVITNAARREELVLDWANPQAPVRRLTSVRARHTAGPVASRSRDNLDAFWVGPDGGIGTTWWSEGQSWAQPYGLVPSNGARGSSSVASLARGPDRLDAFYIGQDGAIASTAWYVGSGWMPPFAISPPNAAHASSDITAVARDADHLDVFWIGPDGAIGSTAWNPDADSWATPFPITPPGAARADSKLAAIARDSEKLDVFFMGRDGAVATVAWSRAGGWSAPLPITPPNAARGNSPVTAVARNPDHIDVFYIGPDGAIGSVFRAPPGPWSAPFPLTGPGQTHAYASIAAVSRDPGDLDLFWVGPDRSVHSRKWSGAWSPPFVLTDPEHVRSGSWLSAVSREDSRWDLFWVGPDGAIGSLAHAEPNAWFGPFPITPVHAVRPAPAAVAQGSFVVARVPEHLDVFWLGPDRAIGGTWWDKGYGWGWTYPLTPSWAAAQSASITSVARSAEKLDVFFVGPDGAVGSTAWAPSTGWWWPYAITPPGAARGGSPLAAVARNEHHLGVFWIGPDGAIGSTAWDASSQAWLTPFPVTPPGAAGGGSPLQAVARGDSHIDLFWIGPDGAIGSTAWDASAWSWLSPFPITPPGAARSGSPLQAVARHANHLDVLWIGPDGAIASTAWDAASWSWLAPFPITPPGAARWISPLAATARGDAHLDVFWVGPDGAIGSTAWDAFGPGWATPFPITPPGAAGWTTPLAAVARNPTHLDVFWIGPDRAVGSTAWDQFGGGWLSPFPVTPSWAVMSSWSN
jgi:hypothetical protein